ncbi:MAG: hypothetical protein FJ004_00470 [Chloroflexi bacterium]|nr:hypothetical protein [Chloroflexota bacterium]
MKMIEWIGSAISRPWQFFKESFFGGRELVPLEEDPVGEFLDRKNNGLTVCEEEENKEQQADGETAQPAVATAANEGKEEKVELVAIDKVGDGQKLNEPGVAEKKTEEFPVAATVAAKTEESQPANKATEEPAKAEDKPQALEAVNQNAASANQPSAEKPKGAGDKDTDSLLDVFRSEQDETGTLGAISEDLSDMSIYSLLEEGKKIVAKIRGGQSESS